MSKLRTADRKVALLLLNHHVVDHDLLNSSFAEHMVKQISQFRFQERSKTRPIEILQSFGGQ